MKSIITDEFANGIEISSASLNEVVRNISFSVYANFIVENIKRKFVISLYVDSKQLLLYVENEGEVSREVTVSNVNISAEVGGNSPIQIDSGNFGCEIHTVSSGTGVGIWRTNIAPLQWSLHTVPNRSHHRCKQGDRNPYQELENRQPDSPSAIGHRMVNGSVFDFPDSKKRYNKVVVERKFDISTTIFSVPCVTLHVNSLE
ncbi:hypothetical protein GOBAR_DD28918 [Gossypium barbadense]|nr:hypothetical protein GOBAR_DD28918 [Gossypium barbadense]